MKTKVISFRLESRADELAQRKVRGQLYIVIGALIDSINDEFENSSGIGSAGNQLIEIAKKSAEKQFILNILAHRLVEKGFFSTFERLITEENEEELYLSFR